MSDDRTWLLADRVCLGDPEHLHAATFVGTGGDQLLMVIDGDHQCRSCPLPPAPRHEHTGPLPADLADRLRRCGAPTTAGRPCRQYPTSGSTRCWQHGRQAADRAGPGGA